MPKNKPNRKRDVHFHFCVDEEEAALIRQRMTEMGVTSMGAYFRKMAINGYHVTLDLSDVREMVRLLKNATDNVNQVIHSVKRCLILWCKALYYRILWAWLFSLVS
jgi:hypothetical protein